jgi:hypothetical protein
MEKVTKQQILKKIVSTAGAREVGDKIGANWKNINLGQFSQGLKVETEHKDITKGCPILTGKIALAHLKEIPDYYTRLKKMEDGAKK